MSHIASDFTCVYWTAVGTSSGTTDVYELGFSYLSISVFTLLLATANACTEKLKVPELVFFLKSQIFYGLDSEYLYVGTYLSDFQSLIEFNTLWDIFIMQLCKNYINLKHKFNENVIKTTQRRINFLKTPAVEFSNFG